jgi:hypothetical protein
MTVSELEYLSAVFSPRKAGLITVIPVGFVVYKAAQAQVALRVRQLSPDDYVIRSLCSRMDIGHMTGYSFIHNLTAQWNNKIHADKRIPINRPSPQLPPPVTLLPPEYFLTSPPPPAVKPLCHMNVGRNYCISKSACDKFFGFVNMAQIELRRTE